MPKQSESKIVDVVGAVKGIVEAVPIYQDAIQPAAKEIGKTLEIIAKSVNVALAPISGFVWGYEQIKDFVSTRVAEKLKSTPLDEIQTPKANIAGPALEALRYTGHESELRELYANLLAASLDAKTVSLAHPSFVEIIKQLAPDEARLMVLFTEERIFPVISIYQQMAKPDNRTIEIMRHFSILCVEAGCEHPHLGPAYLGNLGRLGLIEIGNPHYIPPKTYRPLKNSPDIKEVLRRISKQSGSKPVVIPERVLVTQLGRQFTNACVLDHAIVRDLCMRSQPKLGSQ